MLGARLIHSRYSPGHPCSLQKDQCLLLFPALFLRLTYPAREKVAYVSFQKTLCICNDVLMTVCKRVSPITDISTFPKNKESWLQRMKSFDRPCSLKLCHRVSQQGSLKISHKILSLLELSLFARKYYVAHPQVFNYFVPNVAECNSHLVWIRVLPMLKKVLMNSDKSLRDVLG